MESALYGIYALVVFVSEILLVRFLIRQQLVRKYRTPALSMKYSLFTCNVNYSGPRRALGSFSDDDGDSYENVKKAKGLSSKTTTLHVPHALSVVHFFAVPARLQLENAKFHVLLRT